MIPLFDAHCDTLMMLEFAKLPVGSLGKNKFHVALERLGGYAPSAQFFAIFGMEQMMPGGDIFDRLYSRFIAEVSVNSERMQFCKSAADAEKAAAANKVAAFLSVEGAFILKDGERLEEAYEKGVRMLTLTWNNANGISGTNTEDTELGLTQKGKELVRRCQSMGVIVDLSHISERGFWDTVEIAQKPVIASHSNSAAVHKHSRNLSDEQLRALRDIGGVTGLNLYGQFLGGDSMDDCLRHIEHILDVGGEKVLALGGDLDGCDQLPAGITGSDGWASIYNALADRGYPKPLLDDIFYNKLMRVVRNICDM